MSSITKSELENRLIHLFEGWLAPHGFRPVDIDCVQTGRTQLRVFLEKSNHEGPSIEDCAKMSRILGPAIDVEGLIQGSYDLEVSSPGLDRRLRLAEDFDRHLGQEVKFRFVDPIPGLGGKARVKLLGREGTEVIIEHNSQTVRIALPKIKRANVVWDNALKTG